jgi:RHS repeat-associated protein
LVHTTTSLTELTVGNTTATGFTGAYLDPVTRAYPLGNGYRWYLPGPMRFNVPDDFSPFGAGGINPYVYCAADPVNHSDPSGHVSPPPVDAEVWAVINSIVDQVSENAEARVADTSIAEANATRNIRAIDQPGTSAASGSRRTAPSPAQQQVAKRPRAAAPASDAAFPAFAGVMQGALQQLRDDPVTAIISFFAVDAARLTRAAANLTLAITNGEMLQFQFANEIGRLRNSTAELRALRGFELRDAPQTLAGYADAFGVPVNRVQELQLLHHTHHAISQLPGRSLTTVRHTFRNGVLEGDTLAGNIVIQDVAPASAMEKYVTGMYFGWSWR